MKRKKGQAWGFDLMMAAILFVLGIIIFYFYSLNYPTEGGEKIDSLTYDSNLVADSLLTEGYPPGWDESTYVKVGILTNGKVDQAKLDLVDLIPYDDLKESFNTKYQFYVTLEIDGAEVEEIGQDFSDPENLVKTTRLVVFNDQPVKMNVFIWE